MTNDDIASAWVHGAISIGHDEVSPETVADAEEACSRFYAQRSVTVIPPARARKVQP